MPNKTVLILDTVTPYLYVVLLDGGGAVLSRRVNGNAHSRILTGAVDEVLSQSGVSLADVGVFACDVGPGSFTGIRIGVATLKAYLTVFKKAKTVAFTSLEALEDKTKAADCLMDAGRNLFYCQKFVRGRSDGSPTLIGEKEARELIAKGAAVFDSETDFTENIANVVSGKIARGEFACELEPVYLRKPQAQEDYEKKLVKEINISESEIINGMLEIEKACFDGEAWDRTAFLNINKDNAVVMGIFDRTALVAYGIIYVAADEADLATIGVLPQFRRKGYGGAVLSALIEKARQRGIKKITLEVSKGNESAINLYRGFGFTKVGERKNYYENSNFGDNDAFIMAMKI